MSGKTKQNNKKTSVTTENKIVSTNAVEESHSAYELLKTRQTQSQIIANYGTWEWNLESDGLIWSENLYNILEYDRENTRPSLKGFFKRIHPEDLKRVFKTINDSKKEQKVNEVEFRLLLPDASIKNLYCYTSIIEDENTKRGYVLLGTVQDITERKKEEQSLKQNEIKFRSLAEESLQGIFVHRNFKPLFANQKCADIFGFKNPEEILQLDNILSVFWAPEEKARIERYNENRMLSEVLAPTLYECRGHRLDGSEFWFENHVSIVEWEGEKAVQVAIIDISKRKQTEAELIESEKRYKRIVEIQPECVKTIAADGTLLSMNSAGLAHVEADSFDEVEGVCVYDVVIPEDRHIFIDINVRVFKGETVDGQFRIKGLKGTQRWMETHAVPVYENPDKTKVKAHLAITRDITQRKKFEQSLIESEERFRNSFEFGPLGMGIAKLDGTLQEVNKIVCEMFGYSEEELVNEDFKQYLHPDDLELTVQNLKQMLSGKTDHYQQVRRYRHKKGHYIWTDNNVSLLHDSEGNPKFLVNHLQDINAKIQSDNLQQAQHKILKQIVSGYTQKEILTNLCLLFEELSQEGAMASVLLLNPDDKKLYVGAAPSMSDILKSAFDGFITGNNKASCGTAVHLGKTVVVEDITKNEYWKDFKEFGIKNGILACWSTPFFAENGDILGTFALSHPKQICPSKEDIARLELGGYLASIVVTRSRVVETLKLNEQKYKILFDENPCMFFTVDESATILSANKFGAAELGYDTKEIIGRNLSSFAEENDVESIHYNLKQSSKNLDAISRWEMQVKRQDGTKLWVRALARVTKDEHNENTILVTCEDITEGRLLSEKLKHEATHDGLTGLINRREFEQRLERAIISAKSGNTEHVLCYLDLDRFKVINDSCGHIAGDKLLKQLSDLLHSNLRSRDSLARIGGDEFGLLIENCTLDKAEKIARKIKDQITEFQFYWDDNVYKVGVSIGMVEMNRNVTSVSDILMLADNACYSAKDNGRDCIHIHMEDDVQLENRRNEILWSTRIQNAFDENRFRLVYQPIIPVDKNNDKGEHGEILLRMEDADGNIIPPGTFIPVAERYNLITNIDKHVIEMSFSWLNENPELIKRLFMLSINLSGPSLIDSDILKCINENLLRFNIPAKKICFEITETAAITNLSKASHFINVLKEHGCNFALDDFGSGVSSFAYLKTLPVDYLKIDGAFVRDIEHEQGDLAIVKSIHEISKAMHKKTIAEYVENDSILQILKGIGVDYVQGYAIDMPMPLKELNRKCQQSSIKVVS